MKLEDNHKRVALFVAQSDHQDQTRRAVKLMPRADQAGLATP